MSVDPYLRSRTIDRSRFVPSIAIGQVVVLENENYKVGEYFQSTASYVAAILPLPSPIGSRRQTSIKL